MFYICQHKVGKRVQRNFIVTRLPRVLSQSRIVSLGVKEAGERSEGGDGEYVPAAVRGVAGYVAFDGHVAKLLFNRRRRDAGFLGKMPYGDVGVSVHGGEQHWR